MSTKQAKIDLRARVLADGTVSGLIGTRLYPFISQSQPIYPFATYSVVADTPNYTHAASEAEQRETVWQFDIFAESAGSAEDVCDAIRARLEGTKFVEGSTDFGSVFVDTEFDNFDDAARDDGLSGIFRKTLQIRTRLQTS